MNLKRIILNTTKPVAYDSPDHLQPWGTSRDNSTNPRFNRKIYRLFADLDRPLCVLDLGCSGGGFIRSCLNDGCTAVGVEGSDYSKRTHRAEWAYLADICLFTADITTAFRIDGEYDSETVPLKFDVVTSWDVLEHIATSRLPGVIDNIKAHLSPTGIAVFSISNSEHVLNGARLHQTVESKKWWVSLFAAHGLTHLSELETFFGTQFIRGPKYAAPSSFHVVLSLDPAHAPVCPTRSFKERVWDAWFGSRSYWRVQRVLEHT